MAQILELQSPELVRKNLFPSLSDSMGPRIRFRRQAREDARGERANDAGPTRRQDKSRRKRKICTGSAASGTSPEH
ncbi:hypothetical protein PIB30_037857 [Stylosanthes scabra]|uniref:Uncharacterized protein n=1 Tax=Stylosanthes scabra TaxID=79078 RepID=A0ABU6VFB2_9FABA|nr:hypothetical protein [Stylosanthes scabra]